MPRRGAFRAWERFDQRCQFVKTGDGRNETGRLGPSRLNTDTHAFVNLKAYVHRSMNSSLPKVDEYNGDEGKYFDRNGREKN
jgi:hypothetical protein